MIKHVGKHNNKKVVVLYRKVPGEDHMALVTYSDLLPRTIHDTVMETLESPVGQQSKEFADALFRQTMSDGRNCLQTLHAEGYIKKVPTNQVIVTPTASSQARLDEINEILDKMAMGEEAKSALEEIDANSGIKGTREKAKDVGEPEKVLEETPVVDEGFGDGVLSDAQIAANLSEQAKQMKAEAKRLVEEAKRLEAEAKELKPKRTTRGKTKAQSETA